MKAIWDRIGRRGAFLAFLAILDIVYGYSLFVQPGPLPLDLILSAKSWSIVWLVVGVICASGVFLRQDWPQYTVASAMKAAWGALFLDLWLVHGYPRGWASAIVWLSFAATVALIGSWPESPVVLLPPAEKP